MLCDRVLLCYLLTSHDIYFGYWLVFYRSVSLRFATRRNEICTKTADAFTVRSGRSPASHSKAPNCSEDFTCAMGSSHSGHPWHSEWGNPKLLLYLYAQEHTTSQSCFLYRAINISGVNDFEPIPLAFDCSHIELAAGSSCKV